MAQSINLIPKIEVVEQRKTRWVKLSSIVMIILALVAVGVSGFIIYKTSQLKSQISTKASSMSGLRTQIQALADIEINARNLDQKYRAIISLLDTKQYHSILVEELQAQTPSDVIVDSFTFGREDAINLSGTGSDYLSISTFIDQLLDTDLFTEVTISSVSLEKSTNRAKYFIVVSYNTELLKK
jgi:Tfp pilus assembly protein PilN